MEVIALPQRRRRNRSIRLRGGRAPQLPPRGTPQYLGAAAALRTRRTRVGLRFPAGLAKRQRRRNRAPRVRGSRQGRLRGLSVPNYDMGMGMSRERFSGVEQSPLSRQMGTSRPGGRVYPFHGDEEIGNVNGGNTFAVVQYPVNPGQATTFPWLSKEAQLYERYVFTQLEFYYQTTLNATSATAVGKVVYSMDFDASDAPPTSKQQAMDSEPAESCAPWENMALIIPTVQLEQCFTDAKYVRPGGLPGASDIKTYDLGNLNVVTDSNTATTALGELHVRYAGFFMNRVLEATASAPNNNSVAWFQSSGPESVVTATPYELKLATATINGLGIVNTNGSCLLPAGNYLIDVQATASDSAAEAFEFDLTLQKDGSGLITGKFKNALSIGAGEDASISLSGYISSNGTNSAVLTTTCTGAAGTLTVTGSMRIVAV